MAPTTPITAAMPKEPALMLDAAPDWVVAGADEEEDLEALLLDPLDPLEEAGLGVEPEEAVVGVEGVVAEGVTPPEVWLVAPETVVDAGEPVEELSTH